MDKTVVSVECEFCANNVVPLRTQKDFNAYEKIELAKEKTEKNKPVHFSKNGKRLGRPPRKDKSKSDIALENIESYFKKKKKAQQKQQEQVTHPEVVSNLVNETPVVSKSKKSVKSVPKIKPKKAKKEGKKKMENKKSSTKRGRKPTVGTKIVDFVNAQPGVVTFEEILSVYSEERERLGKKDPDAKIEERNCRSTLYIMVRDSKIKEVDKKKSYTAV